jgi:hypothetical protein
VPQQASHAAPAEFQGARDTTLADVTIEQCCIHHILARLPSVLGKSTQQAPPLAGHPASS